MNGQAGDDPIEQEAAALYDIAEMEKEVVDEFAARNAAIDRLTADRPGVYSCVFRGPAQPGIHITDGGTGPEGTAVDLAGVDLVTAGWIQVRGRVRIEGVVFRRDETGMLLVRPGGFGSSAPPVSTP